MPACRSRSNAGERRPGEWTEAEDLILIRQQEQPGMENHWTAIARMIPARSEAVIPSHELLSGPILQIGSENQAFVVQSCWICPH